MRDLKWEEIKRVLDSWREQAKRNEVALDLLNNIQFDLEALATSD